jgi:hypothetical protein
MRQVNLNFEQDDFETLARVLYALGCEDNALEKAIGYLSTWGYAYPFVDIYITNHKEAEFTACYRTKVGVSPTFVLGAVFNKQSKKFEFHS